MIKVGDKLSGMRPRVIAPAAFEAELREEERRIGPLAKALAQAAE